MAHSRRSSLKTDQRAWLEPGDQIACSLEKLGERRFKLT
jgi:hypothetical protein